jgi:hypothetical protein
MGKDDGDVSIRSQTHESRDETETAADYLPFDGLILRSFGTCFKMARRSRSKELRGTFRPIA